MIACCSTLRIGPYLFYIEKFTTQFDTTEKMIGHHARFRQNDDLPIWRGPAAKLPQRKSRHVLMRAR